ncbi:MAG: MBL fold metallo-hydrolase [Gemmatimonadaceae bacterium]
MLIKRFYHDGLAQASFLVGCQQTGEALVIDANRDADQYIAAATAQSLRITHVTETHIHADYLSGSRELASHTGASLLLSAEGGPDWQYGYAAESGATPLRDGDSLLIGFVRIDVLHTPGHTPEHLTFVVTDGATSPHPVGAFTGDFIFVGDVGRPDLLERAANVAGTMRAGASALFASLARFGSRYPDYLQIWPGHGAGSACGKALGAVPQSTLGYEKLVNWAFQIHDEATFIDSVLDGQPDPPVYFATMKRLNRDGPPILGAAPRLSHRPAQELDGLLANGGVVVDIRANAEYAAGHIPGTLNIPLKNSFVGWAGWLLQYDRDIYLLSRDDSDQRASAAAMELSKIGLDRVAGWFGSDALSDWQRRNGELATVPQVSPTDLAARLASGPGKVTIIDVRRDDEWADGHIPGAIHVPLGRLLERLSSLPLTGTTEVVVQCQGGSRSAIGASLLRSKGIAAENLRGGMTEWSREGHGVVRDDPPTVR